MNEARTYIVAPAWFGSEAVYENFNWTAHMNITYNVAVRLIG